MLKFNNDHIFTGYLKQVLASFNLPKFRIYTKENADYYAKYGVEKNIVETVTRTPSGYPEQLRYVPYIKNDQIQEYVDGKWIHCITDDKHNPRVYEDGLYIPNYTKTLKITNNIYDTYTHEYLGDFLRFQRDYNNLDLMPLYNCFSNTICYNLFIKANSFVFDSLDANYKIYMVPVKLFKYYTIALDCDTTVEMCCGIYGKYKSTDTEFGVIPELTYQKYYSLNFSNPILYTALDNINDIATDKNSLVDLAQNESDLKLFIKLPANNTSSITILEGDYRGWNDTFYVTPEEADSTNWDKKLNHVATNYEYFNEDSNFRPITPLQLLRLNTGTSYPFADRLIEYLSGNNITQLDEISDNILRVQTVLGSEQVLKDESGELYYRQYNFTFPGIWQNKIRPILYDYMNDGTHKKMLTYDINHDILGYVDRTLEANVEITDRTGKKYTLEDVDIYPDIYKDSKVKEG